MLANIPDGGLTAPVLVGITILLILTGQLVPRIFFRDKIKEADKWREAYENERSARENSDRQTAELLEVAKTTHAIINAMFGSGGVIRKSGGSNVPPKP